MSERKILANMGKQFHFQQMSKYLKNLKNKISSKSKKEEENQIKTSEDRLLTTGMGKQSGPKKGLLSQPMEKLPKKSEGWGSEATRKSVILNPKPNNSSGGKRKTRRRRRKHKSRKSRRPRKSRRRRRTRRRRK